MNKPRNTDVIIIDIVNIITGTAASRNITNLKSLAETNKQAEECCRRESSGVFTIVLDDASIHLLITDTTAHH